MRTKLFLLFVVFNIAFCTHSFAQVHSKDTLYVESVNFTTETVIAISCPNFEENFEKSIKFKVVTNKDTLAVLDSFLSKVKYARKSNDIDVRAKFIYEKENSIKIKICVSKFDILVDGRLIKSSSKFLNFLKGLAI